MNRHDKGYLEGIIDGEGCLCLYKYKMKSGNFTYVPELTIANKNKRMLEKIKRIIKSGNIYKLHQRQSYIYAYKIQSTGLKKLLPRLKLIIKEKERQLMLKILKILEKRRYGFGAWNPNYKLDKLKKLYKQMRKQ